MKIVEKSPTRIVLEDASSSAYIFLVFLFIFGVLVAFLDIVNTQYLKILDSLVLIVPSSVGLFILRRYKGTYQLVASKHDGKIKVTVSEWGKIRRDEYKISEVEGIHYERLILPRGSIYNRIYFKNGEIIDIPALKSHRFLGALLDRNGGIGKKLAEFFDVPFAKRVW